MYESLKLHCRDFRLYIFAFDDETKRILTRLSLEHVIVIGLDAFEDDRLLSVKPSRSAAEYCWTSTPSTISYVLNNYHEPHCTYIDADIYFFSDPSVLFRELENRSIMITEHRYTPRYDLSKLSGKYCVQYITFKNDHDGVKALQWWKNACLEWCYAREEDGKFGDQKYLDDWTKRFNGIHVLDHFGGGVAPWNVQQYDILIENNILYGNVLSTGERFPIIFYHFHYLRFYDNRTIDLGDYRLSPAVRSFVYAPYVLHLDRIVKLLSAMDSSIDWYGNRESAEIPNRMTTMLKRIMKGQYNVVSFEKYRGSIEACK
jgi:hypothetical protein